uniref:Uncharacterized protein n=1 Tax=Anopheles melas TaxID=34690 RepID=A0A182UHD4_9DIPT
MSTTSSWDDSVKMSSNNAPNSAATTPSTGGTTVQTESTKCGGSYGAPSSPIALEEGGCPPIKVAAGDEEPALQRPATPPPRAYHCGWFALRPKWMERFMTPKWALFWLCWAGAVQGKCEMEGDVQCLSNACGRIFCARFKVSQHRKKCVGSGSSGEWGSVWDFKSVTTLGVI